MLINKLLRDVWFESETCFSNPDKESYLAISVPTLLLQTSQLNDCQLSHPKTGYHFTTEELLIYFITHSQKIVRSAAAEVLLWLFYKDEKIYKHCFDSSEDIVILEKIIKVLNLMDKSKYYFEFILKESNAYSYLVDLLGRENDPPFMRQVYKLLSLMPVSVSVPWMFLQKTHSCDLFDKLNYVLDQMEACNRDEIESQMLLYSTHIFVNLCQEFEKNYQNKYLYEDDGFHVITKWLLKLEDAAYPENSLLFRLTVVSVLHILIDASIFPRSQLLGVYDSNLWQALLLIIIDDDPEIKNLASEIVLKMKVTKEGQFLLVVPSKALDLMIEIFVEVKKDNPVECITMLINWMLSSNTTPLDYTSDEQPFDKGEMNVFSEDLSLTLIASKHLTAFFKSLNFKVNTILIKKISNWKDSSNESLTFHQFISLCLTETNSTIDSILKRTSLSPMLDIYVDRELLQINQKLTVVLQLLPQALLQTDFKILGNKILRKFHSLNFKTYFIEGLIFKIQQLLDSLHD